VCARRAEGRANRARASWCGQARPPSPAPPSSSVNNVRTLQLVKPAIETMAASTQCTNVECNPLHSRLRAAPHVLVVLMLTCHLPAAISGHDSAAIINSTCSRAISVYAMQKTGSTFLARFLREIAVRHKLCRVFQNVKEYKCESTLYVDCPRTQLHRKTVSLQRTFTTATGVAAAGSRRPVGGNPWCHRERRQQMFQAANDWLRSTDVTVKYRYNESLTWLLSPHGFLRGPLRQLYLEYTDDAIPFYPGFDNRIVVHTRHPVEMMVSAFHCIANASVCPIRTKQLGLPLNDTVSSLDDFVLQGLRRRGSTPQLILQRNLAISEFMRRFPSSDLVGRRRPGHCEAARLLHSKYELMVTDFGAWAKQILEHVIAGVGQRKALLRTLEQQYRNEFVPATGATALQIGHKVTLRHGANLAKLRGSTIERLKSEVRLASLLQELGYDYQMPRMSRDRGRLLQGDSL